MAKPRVDERSTKIRIRHRGLPVPGGGLAEGAADVGVAGWAFQWLAQLSFSPGSQPAPQDQVRTGTGTTRAARPPGRSSRTPPAARADGDRRIPMYVSGGGYDEAPLTWDPAPASRPARPAPRARLGTGRFECMGPASWGSPEQELSLDDERYGHVSVMDWGGMHPRRGVAWVSARPS